MAEPERVPTQGTMMHTQLTITAIIERAGTVFGDRDVIFRCADGELAHRTYRELLGRVRRLASSLTAMGIGPGDRVASFGWNTAEHLELYFAVPAIGAVLHTLNIRLSTDDLRYIIDDAADSAIFYDPTLAATLPASLDSSVRLIALPHVGTVAPSAALDYEHLIASGDPDFAFPDFAEDTAAILCYTSGTTGRPKGVVYTHRSICLYSLIANQPDSFGVHEADIVMPIVPMFHANAWGFPYIAAMAGASLVLPGPAPTPQILTDLIQHTGCTIAAAVPTIWQGVLEVADGKALQSVRELIGGGSAVPEALIEAFETNYGISLVQGWGMTETSPLAAISRVADYDSPAADRFQRRARQGRVLPFTNARIDAESGGELQLRGPSVAGSYYHGQSPSSFTHDGWLRTGDIAEIDEHYSIKLLDRTKDLVKSGGEWISSVELENAALYHSAVAEAAVIARPDPKWGERPVMFVVTKTTADHTSPDEIQAFLADRFPRWWVPDDIEFVQSIPKTSVGKINKKQLRSQLADAHSAQEQTP